MPLEFSYLMNYYTIFFFGEHPSFDLSRNRERSVSLSSMANLRTIMEIDHTTLNEARLDTSVSEIAPVKQFHIIICIMFNNYSGYTQIFNINDTHNILRILCTFLIGKL